MALHAASRQDNVSVQSEWRRRTRTQERGGLRESDPLGSRASGCLGQLRCQRGEREPLVIRRVHVRAQIRSE